MKPRVRLVRGYIQACLEVRLGFIFGRARAHSGRSELSWDVEATLRSSSLGAQLGSQLGVLYDVDKACRKDEVHGNGKMCGWCR